MPYIDKDLRPAIDSQLESLIKELHCAGDFNYTIFKLIGLRLNSVGMKYQNLNEMIGMLECCKLEIYRRIIASYEDQAIAKNGDVQGINWLDNLNRESLK